MVKVCIPVLTVDMASLIIIIRPVRFVWRLMPILNGLIHNGNVR